MTDRDRIERAGRLLHGPSWQTPLAADLGVTLRTVQRWAAGTSAPPEGVWADLARLLRAKAPMCLQMARELDRAA